MKAQIVPSSEFLRRSSSVGIHQWTQTSASLSGNAPWIQIFTFASQGGNAPVDSDLHLPRVEVSLQAGSALLLHNKFS